MWNRLTNLPRDTRDTLFLLVVIAWILAPQVQELPIWCSALSGLILLWRGTIAWRALALPSRWWLFALLVVTTLATYFSHRTLLGRDAGTTFIVVLLALKTLELRAQRDARKQHEQHQHDRRAQQGHPARSLGSQHQGWPADRHVAVDQRRQQPQQPHQHEHGRNQALREKEVRQQREEAQKKHYKSIALRKGCCHIRKMEPLARALAGKDAWITGLRREQSGARADVPLIDRSDTTRVKINPLANWTWGDVWHFIALNKIDYNPLHDQFFPSIGCAPCTRAISMGEDFRAGRWWWLQSDSKECGLHVNK